MLSAAELTRLWPKHAPALLLMARSRCGTVAADQADDCVQEAFIRLAAQQTVPDDPAAWLVRVVRNAAMHNFHDVYGHFPPQALVDGQGGRLLSWRVLILPWLEESALYNEFHLDEPWDSEHNSKLIPRMPDVFRAQTFLRDTLEPGRTRFVAPLTLNSTFGRPGGGVRIQEITDATSNTLLVVEASADKAVIWTKPEDLSVSSDDPLLSIINRDAEGFWAGMCDGSALFLSRKLDAGTLRALMSINGADIIDLGQVAD